MEDKHTALVVLGIIVILAIIGIVLMIKAEKTGEAICIIDIDTVKLG